MFTPPMSDVTDSAEVVVDIWSSVFRLLESKYSDLDTVDWDVEYVYSNESGINQHILIKTNIENAYLVIVTDIKNKCIYGYHFLNLNKLYGLGH